MKIVFYLTVMFIACYIAGFMFGSLKNHKGIQKYFRLQLGYAYYLVAFYISYVLIKDVFFATLITCILPSAFLLCKIWGKVRNKVEVGGVSLKYAFIGKNLFFALIMVFSLAGWPYIINGWSNYWHSGNEDIEDGLNGKDVYINGQIYDDSLLSMEQGAKNSIWKNFTKDLLFWNIFRESDIKTYYSAYLDNGFRLQYSNLAFWSCLLDEKDGIDILIIHAIFNLMLMAIGVFSLARIFFQLSGNWSVVAAFSSVAGSFYLGTFWAGHIGSLMYGAIAPMLATFVLASKKIEDWKTIAPGLALGTASMIFTYPQALVLGFIYWGGYRVYTSSFIAYFVVKLKKSLNKELGHKILFIVIGFFLLCVVIYCLWQGTEAYRLRQDAQYRSWGLVHDPGMTAVFFGYIPNPLFLSGNLAYIVLTSIGIISSIIFIMLLVRYKGIQVHFIRFFISTWVIGLLFFYVFIQDSYYIYKYLYTHQFIIIIAFCSFIAASQKTWVRVLGGGLLSFNIGSDVVAGNQVFQMPHNRRFAEYEQLANLRKDILSTTFVDLTGGDGTAVRQTLKKHKIDTEIDPRFAKYFVIRKQTGGDISGAQLGEVVFNTDFFEVRKSPEKNYLIVRAYFEPEVYPSDPLLKSIPYRWVGPGKNDNVGIYVIHPDHSSDIAMPFLRICGQKGPSAIGSMVLNISSGDGKKLGDFSLEGTNCVWLPSSIVKDAVQPLILRSGLVGKKLRPPEDRKLLYRLFSIAWVDRQYDEKALSLLNPRDDYLLKASETAVKLGNGWWPPEFYNNEHFRWASDGAEIFVPSQCSKTKFLLNIEIGPSHGSAPALFSVVDSFGKVLSTTKFLSNRQHMEFAVSQPGIYRLSTDSEHKFSSWDYRILDFRVLDMQVSGC